MRSRSLLRHLFGASAAAAMLVVSGLSPSVAVEVNSESSRVLADRRSDVAVEGDQSPSTAWRRATDILQARVSRADNGVASIQWRLGGEKPNRAGYRSVALSLTGERGEPDVRVQFKDRSQDRVRVDVSRGIDDIASCLTKLRRSNGGSVLAVRVPDRCGWTRVKTVSAEVIYIRNGEFRASDFVSGRARLNWPADPDR